MVLVACLCTFPSNIEPKHDVSMYIKQKNKCFWFQHFRVMPYCLYLQPMPLGDALHVCIEEVVYILSFDTFQFCITNDNDDIQAL